MVPLTPYFILTIGGFSTIGPNHSCFILIFPEDLKGQKHVKINANHIIISVHHFLQSKVLIDKKKLWIKSDELSILLYSCRLFLCSPIQHSL